MHGGRRQGSDPQEDRPHPAAEGEPQAPRLQPEARLRRLGRRGHPPARGHARVRPLRRRSPKLDAEAQSVTTVDFDNDGKPDICLCGANKVVLLQNGGDGFIETALPGLTGGARAAVWADHNGDGLPDLLARHADRPAAVHEPRQGPVPRRHASGCRRKPRTTSPPPRGATSTATASRTSCSPTASTACGSTRTSAPDAPKVVAAEVRRLARDRHVPRRQPRGQLQDRVPGREARSSTPTKEYKGKRDMPTKWAKKDVQGRRGRRASPSSAQNCATYLYRELDVPPRREVPVAVGTGGNTLTVWLNGEKVFTTTARSRQAEPRGDSR